MGHQQRGHVHDLVFLPDEDFGERIPHHVCAGAVGLPEPA